MQQTIIVTYTDGREAIGLIGAREAIEFERKFDVSVASLGENPRIEWMYFMAYLAMKRLHKAGDHPGPIKPGFDDFLDVVDDIDVVGDDAPLDETAT